MLWVSAQPFLAAYYSCHAHSLKNINYKEILVDISTIKKDMHKLAKRLVKLNGGKKNTYGEYLEFIADMGHCIAEDRQAGRPETMMFFKNYSATIDLSKVKVPLRYTTVKKTKKVTKKKIVKKVKKK